MTVVFVEPVVFEFIEDFDKLPVSIYTRCREITKKMLSFFHPEDEKSCIFVASALCSSCTCRPEAAGNSTGL
jgi:hypothetical protein